MRLGSQGGDDSFIVIRVETAQYKYASIIIIMQCCFLMQQTHLTFGKEFTEAVEMKQVAQQEAERARYLVEKV